MGLERSIDSLVKTRNAVTKKIEDITKTDEVDKTNDMIEDWENLRMHGKSLTEVLIIITIMYLLFILNIV